MGKSLRLSANGLSFDKFYEGPDSDAERRNRQKNRSREEGPENVEETSLENDLIPFSRQDT
jgi:hypothetical protein